MVHGSMNDHGTFAALVAELNPNMTTFAVDRRGFGATPDVLEYAIEKEFEDVAAVVDAVADRAGTPASVWGHSYGANCAMGGATLSDDVHRLILYEPSLGLQYPDGVIEGIEASVAAGDREAALVTVYRQILEFGDKEIAMMKIGPQWETRLASAPTIARECRVENDWRYSTDDFEAITAQTLLLSGSESTSDIKKATADAAAAIANSRIEVLEGHAHMAYKTHPGYVADIIVDFCDGPSDPAK